MRNLVFIFAFFVSEVSFSQTDSLKSKTKFGCAVSLVNFIDYHSVQENITEKTAYYQGFDVSVFIRPKYNPIQLDIGVFGGDKYPVLKGLNYYLGFAYNLKTKNMKNIFEINPKVMYSYSSEPYDQTRSKIRKELSLQLGINYFRNFNRFDIGIGYYFWAGNYTISLKTPIPKNSPYFETIYQKKGFIPIGVLKITARYLFN